MAARAGLPLQDLEFVQFHPTGANAARCIPHVTELQLKWQHTQFFLTEKHQHLTKWSIRASVSIRD